MTVFYGVIVLIGIWVLFLAGILIGAKYTKEKPRIDPDYLEGAYDDAEDEEESYVCRHCNGSGEGQYDGTRCSYCKGTGEEQSTEEGPEYDDFDKDDWLNNGEDYER